MSRRVFLFSYLCFGMSFIDEAMLTKNNIDMFGAEEHIVYKRQKTQNAKNAKPKPAQVMREVATKRRRAMLFSNSAITSTPISSLIAATTTASTRPPAEKCGHLPPREEDADKHLLTPPAA